jgi:hypothetical protein
VLIDRFMPEFDISEHHLLRIEASPERAFDAARGVDLARSKTIRALFAARGLPALLRGRRSGPRTMTLDDLVRAGFVWLAEEPPTEMVLGVAGSFWRPKGGVVRIDADDFESFRRDGLAKGVWNFRVVPVDEATSIVTTETRVQVPDEDSRHRFLLYWAAIGPFSGLIRKQALALIKADAEAAR